MRTAPRFIMNAASAGEHSGAFSGAAVKADIRGFTARFQEMAPQGDRGAEQLSREVNRALSAAVETASKTGGVPVAFAGDAVTMVFSENAEGAEAAASAIETLHRNGSGILPMKADVGVGSIEWDCFPLDGWYFYSFQGSAVSLQRSGGFWNNRKDDRPVKSLKNSGNLFLPPSLFSGETPNEFRQVRSIFLSLEDRRRKGCTREFQRLVLEAAGETGGFVSGLEAGHDGYRMLVVFGAPVSRMDDPERADSFMERVFRKAPGRVRAGGSCGLVFSGTITTPLLESYTVLGPSVNLAARLHDSAGWNTLRVNGSFGDNSLLEQRFRGETPAKGFASPVQYSDLTPWRRRRVVSTFSSPLMEREQVLSEMDQALKEPGMAVVIQGETGSGKSRIIEEEVKKEPEGYMMLRCRSLQDSGTDPLGTWFRGWTGDDSVSVFREKLYGFVDDVEAADASEGAEIADELLRAESVLAAVQGITWEGSLYQGLNPDARYTNTVSVVSAFIRGWMLLGGRTVAIDDLQWIDGDSLDLLGNILAELAVKPSLLVSTSSGDLPEVLGNHYTECLRIELEPLSRQGTSSWLKWRLGGLPSTELLNWFYGKTEGNPFFMEQYADLLKSPSQIPEEGESFPGSLHSLMVAKLDRLGDPLRRMVLKASVLGRDFHAGLLHDICSAGDFQETLRRGVQADIWSTGDGVVYSFVHSLLREAAFRLQLHSARTAVHGEIADAAAKRWSSSPEHAPFLAHHLEMAGRREAAALKFMGAAEHALSRRMNLACLDHAEKALSLSKSPWVRLKALEIIFQLKLSSGDMDGAELVLNRAFDQRHVPPEQKASLRLMQADLAFYRGEPGRVPEFLDGVEEIDPSLRHRVEHYRGRLLMFMGKTEESRDHLLAVYREFRSGTPEERLTAHKALGNAAGCIIRIQKDLNRAEEALKKVLAYSREQGDLLMETLCIGNLALVCKYLPRRYNDAVKLTREHLDMARRTGSRLVEMQALGNLASLIERKSPSDEAFDLYRKALNLSYRYGGNDSIAIAHANYAGALARTKKNTRAITHFEKALEICQREKMKLHRADYAVELLFVLIREERLKEASSIMEQLDSWDLPEDYTVSVEHARALLKNAMGFRSSALEILRALLPGLNPGNETFEILHSLFQITGEKHYAEGAMEEGKRILEEDPRWEILEKISGLQGKI